MRFRAKSLTSLLFAFLLALPMISVISKVIYVQSNKNAYQSYYGETINETIYESVDKFKINYTYYFNYNQAISYANSTDYVMIQLKDLGNLNDNIVAAKDDILYLSIYKNTNNNTYSVRFREEDNTLLYQQIYNANTQGIYALHFSFICLANSNNVIGDFVYLETHNNYSYLDNVFEYAVDEVIKENNFGNIDFFSYFTSIFMSDNQVNNRYIGYVNYYLNYALMVSLAYLLFLMLMWFINFARRFLDRGMNYDW